MIRWKARLAWRKITRPFNGLKRYEGGPEGPFPTLALSRMALVACQPWLNGERLPDS